MSKLGSRLLLFFISLLAINVQARQLGTPYFKYYTPADYKAGNRNWAITSDDDGIVYVANDDGILRFDGVEWELIPLPENQIAYWLEKGPDGTIYVGANGDFGRLISSKSGEVTYESFVHKIPEEFKDFNVVWEIAADKNGVLFRSKKYVFYYSDDTITPFDVPKGGRAFDVAFSVRDTIFCRVYGLGLAYVNPDGIHQLPNSKFFAEKKENGIYAFGKDKFLVATRYEGLYIYDIREGVTAFENAGQQYFIENKLYDGIRLKNGDYAFSTMGDGILIIDAQGKEKFRFDASNGLGKHRPLFVTELFGQLWVGMKNGLCVISYDSPYSFVKQEYGITGQITDILEHKGKIYVTCNDGFYSYDPALGQFEPINNNLLVDCMDIMVNGDELWITNLDNIVRYNPIEEKVVGELPFNSRKLIASLHPDYIISAGFYFGADVLFNGQSFHKVAIEGIERAVMQVIPVDETTFLIKTIDARLYRIKVDVENHMASIINSWEIPNDGQVLKFEEVVLVVSGSQNLILRNDELVAANIPINFSFTPEKLNLVQSISQNTCYVCYQDKLRNYYCDNIRWRGNDSTLVTVGDGVYTEFRPDVIQESRDYLMIGGVSGIKLRSKNGDDKFFGTDKVFIRSVNVDKNKVYNPRESKLMTYDNEPGDIRINYATLSQYSDRVHYQYRLLGINDKWSEWSDRNSVNYSSLPPGYYTFQVKAFTLNGESSKISSISFMIAKPWYAQWYMLLTYLLIAGGLVYLYFKKRVRMLESRKEFLERQVGEKTNELRVANEELAAKATKLEELDNFKSRFFANVTHDLRTPITLLSGRIKQLKEDKDSFYSTATERYLEVIEKASQKLVSMTDDISELVAMEEGKLRLEPKPIEITRYIKITASLFQSAAEMKGISIQTVLPENSQFLKVSIDQEKFDRVMYNLISNALKFTYKGDKIVLEVVDQEAVIQIKVIDNGMGISGKYLTKVFDRNFQDTDNLKAREGMGIGLNVAREIVELHNGKIWVNSAPSKGTAFTIELPKDNSHESIEEVTPTAFMVSKEQEIRDEIEILQENPGEVVPGDKEKVGSILIVEDNKEVRQYMVELLNQKLEVFEAAHGVQALKVLEKKKVDMIITDMMMPVMDGFELIKRIQQNQKLAGHPDDCGFSKR